MRTLLLAAAVLVAVDALACPTCTCANPALTAVGADQPFEGRVRLGAAVRAWEQWDGTRGVDRARLRELRLDVVASWSPWRWLSLTALLPVQLRERTDVALARELGAGPGELELGARVLVLGAEGFRPRHLLSVVGQLRLPTAPTLADAAGPLSLDAQLGPGAFTGVLGVSWTAFAGDRWATWVSLTGEASAGGRHGFLPGPALALLAQGQYQPVPWLALRLGADTRLEAAGWLGAASDGRGGFLGQLLTEVVFSLGTRTLLTLGGRFPLVDARAGGLTAAPTAYLAVLVDV